MFYVDAGFHRERGQAEQEGVSAHRRMAHATQRLLQVLVSTYSLLQVLVNTYSLLQVLVRTHSLLQVLVSTYSYTLLMAFV